MHDLHVFVHSGHVAYGAVAYLTHNEHSVFVMSESRVAPLKIAGREIYYSFARIDGNGPRHRNGSQNGDVAYAAG